MTGAAGMRFGLGLITCQRYPGDPRSDMQIYDEAMDTLERDYSRIQGSDLPRRASRLESVSLAYDDALCACCATCSGARIPTRSSSTRSKRSSQPRMTRASRRTPSRAGSGPC